MPIEHAYLSKIFPKYENTLPDLSDLVPISELDGVVTPCGWFSTKRLSGTVADISRNLSSSDPPDYTSIKNRFRKIMNLVPGEKLRIVNGDLEIDTRKFQSIRRKSTKDSRWTILEKILEDTNPEEEHIRNNILHILRDTYTKDKKWIEASHKKIKL